MYRSSRPVAAVVTVALFVGGVASIAACAMSAPADLTPNLNPDLPGLDAGSNAMPTPGSRPGAFDAGSGAGTSDTSDDGGAKAAFGGDAADADAAPLPSSVPKPAAGEVLITEIMYSTFTPEPASEWIELYSTAASPRSLSGLTLKDGGGRTHVIGASVTIAPGAYVILSRNKAAAVSAKVPAGAIIYEYGTGLPDNAGIILANGATGGISLLDGATSLVSVPYGPWFSQSGGSSIQLKSLGAGAESASSGWCLSLNAWTAGSEKGTPSSAADCP
jgi:hypothetical protein